MTGMADNFIGLTDTGRVRKNNEDTFIAERIQQGTFILACVIDGVGGYAHGEVAAALARQSILDYFNGTTGETASRLRMALLEANERIFAEKEQNRAYNQMACVLTMALVDQENNQFLYAHVGDTRLYLLRDESLIKITKDHSFVGFLEDTGRLSEQAAMRHPKRNEIDKALGFTQYIEKSEDYIETGQSPFLPGDLLLLCSDGLTDLVPEKEITAILTGTGLLQARAEALITAANEGGGKDNVTVVLVYHDQPVRTQGVMPPVAVQKNVVPQRLQGQGPGLSKDKSVN